MSSILIACGGTGGHIYPGLTIGSGLQQQGLHVHFIGSSLRMEKDKIPAAGFAFTGLPIRPMNKRKPVSSLLNWTACTQQARRLMQETRPDAVVGLGSYITVPALLAARSLDIPIFLIETNVVPGKANQLLGRLATWVALAHARTATAFPQTPCHVTGSPVRPEFGRYSRQQGAELFGLNPTQPVLLITGGSQGAALINETIVRELPQFLSLHDLQIVHVCGASNHDQLKEATQSYAGHPRYRLLDYVDNMPALLATTDLAVSRAGASTIAEFLACQVPSVLIPGRFGGGHQLENAEAIQAAGAGLLFTEMRLPEEGLFAQVRDVISDTERLTQMRHNCNNMNTRQAADHIVGLILDTLKLSKKEALSC
ncbi:MAG: undecaprenyldiphospho-muramoylpentapeptide beta-N-acetylglucosaminyltransferase [Candidatus Sericytochromatia bacterium]